MEPLFSLLITVIIVGVVLYVIWWAISQIPLPPPFAVVVRVVFALIVVLVMLGFLFNGMPHLSR